MLAHLRRSETTCRSWFSPSTLCVLCSKFRPSDLVVSTSLYPLNQLYGPRKHFLEFSARLPFHCLMLFPIAKKVGIFVVSARPLCRWGYKDFHDCGHSGKSCYAHVPSKWTRSFAFLAFCCHSQVWDLAARPFRFLREMESLCEI